MRFRDRPIAAGDRMLVWTSRAGFRGHVLWTVSHFYPRTGEIMARRYGDGRLEQLPHYARFMDEFPLFYRRRACVMTKAEREEQLKARDECIAAIRERDRALGIVAISAGDQSYAIYTMPSSRRRY